MVQDVALQVNFARIDHYRTMALELEILGQPWIFGDAADIGRVVDQSDVAAGPPDGTCVQAQLVQKKLAGIVIRLQKELRFQCLQTRTDDVEQNSLGNRSVVETADADRIGLEE